jgi:sulfur relay (sulfurtransferase) complex TusBCD TusD component (DsrE family)
VSRQVALVLSGSVGGEQAGTALKLAERLLARGHRVTVYAHEEAVALSAGAGESAQAVRALLRRGVHGGTLDWVVDGEASARLGVDERQAAGVVPGDASDLWAFVRCADIVLSPGGA